MEHMQEMQTDNPSLPYKDPTAAPSSGLSLESLSLAGAAAAGDVSRVRRLIAALASDASSSLPIPPEQYLNNARLTSATHDLHDACVAGDLDHFRRVLQAWRADPSLQNPGEEELDMALILAAQNGRGSVVKSLLDEGVAVGLTAPKLATKQGEEAIGVYQAFLDHGWDVNSFDQIPTLHKSTQDDVFCSWLLSNGADPNLISKDGHTPLDFAAVSSKTDPVTLLLSHGAILSKSNALHHAVQNIPKDEDCVRLMDFLLEKGADVNALSYQNQPCFQHWPSSTPLHWAVRKHGTGRGRKNMLGRVKWLREHGADPSVKDSQGQLAQDLATDEAIIKLLSVSES